jgi:hypothetical protein
MAVGRQIFFQRPAHLASWLGPLPRTGEAEYGPTQVELRLRLELLLLTSEIHA